MFNFFATKKIRLRKKLFIVFGPVLIFTPIALNFSDKILSQIDSLDYLKWEFIMRRVDEFKPGGYGSFIWRIVYWLKIYFSFIEESFSKIFFGVGIDALTKGNMPYKYMYTDPHNDFLKVLVEYGFFGLALLINFIKNIYFTLQKNMDFIIILFVPMFFDNAIVNFSFNLTLILLFAYDYKKNIIEIN